MKSVQTEEKQKLRIDKFLSISMAWTLDGCPVPRLQWHHFAYVLSRAATGKAGGGREQIVLGMIKCLPPPVLYLIYGAFAKRVVAQSRERVQAWLLVVLSFLPIDMQNSNTMK